MVIKKKLLANETEGPDGFVYEFYHAFREEWTIIQVLFQKTEQEETITNWFYKSTITLILKPIKDITNKDIKIKIYLYIKI